MKNLSLFISIFCLIFLASCEETVNSAEESAVTFLPRMELQGNAVVQVECGESFADPGIIATAQGAEIPVETVVAGSYFGGTSVEGADQYVISYSALNADGIPGSEFRSVTVVPCNTVDSDNDIAGLYQSDVVRSTGEAYTVGNVFVVRTGDNTFALSDVVAGFYDLGKGYGSDYACKGSIITVNDVASNDISVSQGQFPVWGNVADINNVQVDLNAGTITYDVLADFGGMWSATLTRK